MNINFLISQEDAQEIGPTALAILAHTYGGRHPDYTLEVEIHCVDRPEMQKINKEYRNIDSPTDVLSFPTLAHEQEIAQFPPTIPVLIGSIVVCPSKAVEYEETLPQLIHHGMIHLLGYDHEVDLTTWRKIEEPILALLSKENLMFPGVPHEV